MLLIPAIDLRGGQCVRLYQGDFSQETTYRVTPQALCARYLEWGATWLHIVDLDGAKNGTSANQQVIAELASTVAVKLQAGGGIRSAATLQALLTSGVSRVVVGSTAIEQPQEVAQWLTLYGSETICVAFDIRLDPQGVPVPRTRGWLESSTTTLWHAIETLLPHGLKHVLCTDIERDGALTGPNLNLYREAVSRYPQLHWQASGGIRDVADLNSLSELGVAAAISGKALLENRVIPMELQPFLQNASSPA
jgi:phosphoribosylformimino-5-aminoimidazole carboxamide ribotide isomerase